MKTSDITSAKIWKVVVDQWARGEGKDVLGKSGQKDLQEERQAQAVLDQDNSDVLQEKKFSKLSLADSSPEIVYLERLFLPNSITLMAFSKKIPILESCANMVTVGGDSLTTTRHFSRSREDLSILVCWQCPYVDLWFGNKDLDTSSKKRVKAASNVIGALPPTAANQATKVPETLALSHPAIRDSIASCELSILAPHGEELELEGHQ